MVSVERDAPTRFDPITVEALASGFAGTLLQPDDPGYDEARKIWNGMIDRHPALIARCIGVSDVIQAVNFAREQGESPSIRGGGHNVAGHAVSNGGLMIDLSLMRAIHVDPARKIARVEGGATWADFEREASVFGLSTTAGVISTTGVAGLTLGGGIGWLVGKYGLTVDNLLAAEVVTADGKMLRASADEHPDLFWALRGGGGNFGVVTSFEFQLHPVSDVLAGFFAWPADEAHEVAEFYRAFTTTNPEEMTTYLEFARDEESGERLVMIAFCHPGDLTEGERLVDEIRSFREPVAEMVGVMPYRDWQMAFDAEFPHGTRYYWKGVLLREISDEVIDALVEQAALPALESTIVVIEHYRGVMNQVDVEATAFPHRDAQYQVVIVGRWDDPKDDEQGIAWARALNAAIEPYSMRARFLNFNSAESGDKQDVVRSSYGPNYDRLVEVKRRYDPTNMFSRNNNISPD